MLTSIYRYEHPSGYGPYTLTNYVKNLENQEELAEFQEELCQAHQTNEHPCVIKDIHGYLDLSSDVRRCGCLTVERLKDWFKGFNDDLIKLGFRIQRYKIEPEKILHGWSGKQVAFDITDADIEG